MPISKLTLSMPPRIIADAKRYAQRHGKSLSGLIADFLESLTKPSKSPAAIGAKTERVTGLVKASKTKKTQDRDLLLDALLDKYR